ncbi:MAG: dihydropteroate synthase [Alphaproteobacteria bacterium]|nr:dihydropteroate synthase [Alphaproteobacteria bacterium]
MAAETLLVGVLNVTPDSFSDGGRFLDPDRAVAHGLRLAEEGAAWIDVGGESTRPGSVSVGADEQIRRVAPVIEALARRLPSDVVISVDTADAAVATAALAAGARAVNDVGGLRDPGVARAVAEASAELVVMHARGTPATMQRDTTYEDLVGEVEAFLRDRIACATALGVDRQRIVVDPGLGFGKAMEDNPRLVAAVPRFKALGHRVMIGASRKAFVGRLTGVERAEDRLHGSVGAALAAAEAGADLLRVHDVLATRQALVVYAACRGG